MENDRDKLDDDLQIHNFDKSKYEINLPEKNTIVPRFKQLPSEKQLTKWERFAK